MKRFGFIAFLSILACLRFFWICDISFLNDETKLIAQALEDNSLKTITTHGLLGSRGLDYGPFAIWFYRTVLAFTHDLLWVVRIKVLCTSLITLVSLVWLFQICKTLKVVYAPLALLSPYLWIYSRDLWDNSFVVPLSGLSIVSYLSFTQTLKVSRFFVAFISLTCAFLTHLVSLPVLAGCAIHLIFFHRHWMKRNFFTLLILSIPNLILLLPYIVHLFSKSVIFLDNPRDLGHLFMPFLAARFYSTLGLEYFYGKEWLTLENFDGVWKVVLGFTVLSYLFTWHGIFKSITSVIQKEGALFSISALMVLTFLFQILLCFGLKLIPIPNFHSSIWLVTFYFLCLSLSTVNWGWLRKGYVFCFLFTSILFPVRIHLNHGSRAHHYGATLGNLIDIAKLVEKYPSEIKIEMNVKQLKEFPQSLELLRIFFRNEKERIKNFGGRLSIQYAKSGNSNDGMLELKEIF